MPDTRAQRVFAEKAYEAQKRAIEPLSKTGKTSMIPSRSADKQPSAYDRHLYQARPLNENFFAKRKRRLTIATRYDEVARNYLCAIHLATADIWLC